MRKQLFTVDTDVCNLTVMRKLYVAEAATNVTRRCAQLAGYDGYFIWMGIN